MIASRIPGGGPVQWGKVSRSWMASSTSCHDTYSPTGVATLSNPSAQCATGEERGRGSTSADAKS
jgi:hypothetical protein